MLTVKSDDVTGRSRAYEAIVKGENIPRPSVPESFKVLVRELQSISLDVTVLNRWQDGKDEEVDLTSDENEPRKFQPPVSLSSRDIGLEDELKGLHPKTPHIGLASVGVETKTNDTLLEDILGQEKEKKEVFEEVKLIEDLHEDKE